MVSILNEYGEDFLKKVVDFSPEKKLMLGLIYINSQKYLVLLFDKIYHTKLHDFFCDYIQYGIDIIVEGKSIIIDTNEIYSIIPDADDYSEKECSYVQNALLSLYYLFEFYITKEIDFFQQSLDMVLENVDVISYGKDKVYDERKVFSHEVQVLTDISDKVNLYWGNLHDLVWNEDELSPL